MTEKGSKTDIAKFNPNETLKLVQKLYAEEREGDPLFHGEPLGLVHFVGIIANSGAVKNGNAVAGMA